MKNRFFKGILLFKAAYHKTKDQMLISVTMLLVITVFLVIGMYLAESYANKNFNFIDALAWPCVNYVGDPAGIAVPPITYLGKFLGTLVGVIGVAIFAVPSGLIGSGLISAMEDEAAQKKLDKSSVELHKLFRRNGQGNSYYTNKENLKKTYKCVDRYYSATSIQIKLGMKLDDLIETVNYCPDMRLSNFASTQQAIDKPQDRLVVENFPLNTEYGCFMDRKSSVTIVSPSSPNHIGMSSAAFSLAAMGGFNYVSKEIEPNSSEPFGFYFMNKNNLDLIADENIREEIETTAIHFMEDLKRLKQNSEDHNQKHWFIFLLGTAKSTDCQLHFWRIATHLEKQMYTITHNQREYGSLVLNEDDKKLKDIFHEIQNNLQKRIIIIDNKEQNIVSELDNFDRWKSVNASNIMCRIGGGVDCNALVLRIAYEILVYNNFHLLILKDIADSLKKFIEPNHQINKATEKCFLENGDGYADDFGKEDVFKRTPEALNKMIKEKKEEAQKRYNCLNL